MTLLCIRALKKRRIPHFSTIAVSTLLCVAPSSPPPPLFRASLELNLKKSTSETRLLLEYDISNYYSFSSVIIINLALMALSHVSATRLCNPAEIKRALVVALRVSLIPSLREEWAGLGCRGDGGYTRSSPHTRLHPWEASKPPCAILHLIPQWPGSPSNRLLFLCKLAVILRNESSCGQWLIASFWMAVHKVSAVAKVLRRWIIMWETNCLLWHQAQHQLRSELLTAELIFVLQINSFHTALSAFSSGSSQWKKRILPEEA